MGGGVGLLGKALGVSPPAAAAKKQQVFAEEGAGLFNRDSPYRRIMGDSEGDICNYSKFLPWKTLMKASSVKRVKNV